LQQEDHLSKTRERWEKGRAPFFVLRDKILKCHENEKKFYNQILISKMDDRNDAVRKTAVKSLSKEILSPKSIFSFDEKQQVLSNLLHKIEYEPHSSVKKQVVKSLVVAVKYAPVSGIALEEQEFYLDKIANKLSVRNKESKMHHLIEHELIKNVIQENWLDKSLKNKYLIEIAHHAPVYHNGDVSKMVQWANNTVDALRKRKQTSNSVMNLFAESVLSLESKNYAYMVSKMQYDPEQGVFSKISNR
jgi:hypothetical protein